MAKETKVFMDPVHGLITFDRRRGEGILLDLIDSPEFQRLRRIRQLGISWITFPSAVHTRFTHSLGACHLAGRYMDKLYDRHKKSFYKRKDDFDRARLLARVTALLHDIGHGAFSHIFGIALKPVKDDFKKEDFKHENWSAKIIRDSETEVNENLTSEESPISAEDVALVIEGTYKDSKIVRIISGQFDVDRMDYIQRDSLFTGVKYGHIDQEWLIHSLWLAEHEETEQHIIAIDATKGINSIVSFILARLNLFQKVYYHHKTRAAEIQLAKILQRMAELIKGGKNNFGLENYARFIKSKEVKTKDFLALDDFSFISSFNVILNNRIDNLLEKLCTRFMRHKIYKSVEIPEEKLIEKLDNIENQIDNECFKEGTIEDKKDLCYFRGLDEDNATYYTSDLEDTSEIGDEIYIKLKSGKLKKLSLYSDIIDAIAEPPENKEKGQKKKIKKARICFDNDVYDREKVEKIVHGG